MTKSTPEPLVSVDKKACQKCGQCEAACPTDVFSWAGDELRVLYPGWCIKCGHCVAACPNAALVHSQLPSDKFAELGNRGQLVPADLERLFRARRSCRRFRKEPLEREEIEALVEMVRYAPTATNAQNVRFQVISDKAALANLTLGTATYYRKLQRQLSNPIKRGLISLAVGAKTVEAYRYHMPAIMARFHSTLDGKDQLFYNAPHVVILFANGLRHMASANCNLTAMQFLLAAEVMGLGACYNGYALTALVRERSLRRQVGLDAGYHPGAVIAFGRPAAGFYRIPPRRKRRLILL